MTNEAEVECYVKDPSLLVGLCREVIERLADGVDNSKTAAMETQLREIAKTIDNLDKLRVAVPEPLRAEKTRLAAVLGVQEKRIQALKFLTSELELLLRKVKGQPVKNAATCKTERTYFDRLSRKIIRETVIIVLRALGGKATRANVFIEMEKLLKDQFLPADLHWIESTRTYAWQNSTAGERKKMINEGIMRESSLGVWELSEEHR